MVMVLVSVLRGAEENGKGGGGVEWHGMNGMSAGSDNAFNTLTSTRHQPAQSTVHQTRIGETISKHDSLSARGKNPNISSIQPTYPWREPTPIKTRLPYPNVIIESLTITISYAPYLRIGSDSTTYIFLFSRTIAQKALGIHSQPTPPKIQRMRTYIHSQSTRWLTYYEYSPGTNHPISNLGKNGQQRIEMDEVPR